MAKMCSFSEVEFCTPEGLGSQFLPLVLGEALSISVAPVGSFPEGRKAAVPRSATRGSGHRLCPARFPWEAGGPGHPGEHQAGHEPQGQGLVNQFVLSSSGEQRQS